ncbi:MAG TPA: hypothetical protein P5081_22485 [Phycisphaerae bacterium]|nr:hypothetical protein [Phycisphaerae bacterium]
MEGHEICDAKGAACALVKAAREVVEAYSVHVDPSDSKEKYRTIVLSHAMAFVVDGLSIIESLLEQGATLHAKVMARSVFEVCARIQWAAHQVDGFGRLWADGPHADLKWANRAENHPDLEVPARGVKSDPTRMKLTQQFKASPAAMDEILRDIGKAPKHERLDLDPEYIYMGVYRLYCKSTHGEFLAMSVEGASDQSMHVARVCSHAAIMLCFGLVKSFGLSLDDLEDAVGVFVEIAPLTKRKSGS